MTTSSIITEVAKALNTTTRTLKSALGSLSTEFKVVVNSLLGLKRKEIEEPN